MPITGVSGTPALIQSLNGTRGNFELVVPLAAGGLGHFFRDNDNAADINNNRWQKNLQFPFGAELGQIDAVSLIQSSFSAQGNGPGNLGLVARVRDRLYYFFKPDAAPGLWQGPFIFAIDV